MLLVGTTQYYKAINNLQINEIDNTILNQNMTFNLKEQNRSLRISKIKLNANNHYLWASKVCTDC